MGLGLKLSLVKDKKKSDQNTPMDPEPFLTIVKEGTKILAGGVMVVIAFGFLLKTGSDLLVANLTPQ